MNVLTLSTLASLTAAGLALPQINVQLDVQDNTKVRAMVSNTGSEDIKAVTRGGLLSDAPIQKVQISSAYGDVAFKGPKIMFNTIDLSEDEFQSIAPGESIEKVFDIAEWFDLTQGGSFDVRSIGNLQYFNKGVVESIPYSSNTVNATIDSQQAATVYSANMAHHENMLSRRATIADDCTGERRDAVAKSIKRTYEMAIAGAKAARSGPASRLQKIFRRSDAIARKTVAEAFDKMAKLYSSDSQGIPPNHCSDVAGYCEEYKATAFCLPEKSLVGFCDTWFNQYPEVDKRCANHDQGVIAVHEATHLNEVKGTIDNMGENDNLNHADSYAKFAHQALFNCPS